jgi:glucoamylase
MTAAFIGDRDEALARLHWLDQHRTAAGSLPEKVLANGQPASVAPLAWTAAAVVITADQLSG